MGLSILNPAVAMSMNMNQLEVKFYTWNTVSAPAVFSTSDDYVFMKQDATRIPSSTVSWTDTSYTRHTFAKIADQVSV